MTIPIFRNIYLTNYQNKPLTLLLDKNIYKSASNFVEGNENLHQIPHLNLSSGSCSMQNGAPLSISKPQNATILFHKLFQHLPVPSSRSSMNRSIHHILLENLFHLRRRRESRTKHNLKHLTVIAPRSSIQYISDSILSFSQHKRRVPPQQFPDEIHVTGRGGGVEEPPAVAGANEGVDSSSRLAFQHEVPRNLRATFRDVLEVFLVVPHCFEAPNSAEGSELNEEVGVEVEKLHHQIVVAVRGGAIDRRSVPPLLSGALPTQRQV